MVFQSLIADFPICTQIDSIKATETIFTVSKNTDIILDCLNLGITGFNRITNKKEGKKIPTVASIAPCQPPI